MSIVDIKSDKLFPIQFRILGGIMVLIGVVMLTKLPILGSLFLFSGIAMLFAIRGVQIDPDAKTYREYYGLFFLKSGKREVLPDVIMVYVNTIRVSQQIYTKVTETSTIRNIIYKGFLKFANEETLYVSQSKDKDVVMDKMTQIGSLFGLEVIDNS